MQHHPHRRSGFTLVEMAIAMSVIGLLIGGVLAGRELIQSSKLQSVMDDANKYTSAIMQFRDQYRYLPGDMPNATVQWPALPADGNGNGDSIINITNTPNTAAETWMSWQHLALAGLVNGEYTGVSGPTSGGADAIPGVNTPASKLSADSGFQYGGYRDNSNASRRNMFNYDFRNWLLFGGDDNTFLDIPVLTTFDARSIDSKLDDGMPGTGSVVANGLSNIINSITRTCILSSTGTVPSADSGGLVAPANTDRASTYNLANTAARQCALMFRVN